MSSHVPIEFLLTASRPSLQAFELAKLARISQMEKRLKATIRELAEETAGAIVARLLLENEGLGSMNRNPLQESLQFPDISVVEDTGVFSAPERSNRYAAAD